MFRSQNWVLLDNGVEIAADGKGSWNFGFGYGKIDDKMITVIFNIFKLDICDFVTSTSTTNSKYC